jgi:hypothetical protein
MMVGLFEMGGEALPVGSAEQTWARIGWTRALAWEARGRLMEGRSVDEVLGFVLGELERR